VDGPDERLATQQAAPEILAGRAGAAQVLLMRGVRPFVSASLMFSIATFLLAAALGKHIYDITGSTLALGLLGLVEFLPALLLLPVTGPTADRFDRRRVGALAAGVEAVVAVAMAAYALTDPTSVWPLFALAACYGTARAFGGPAIRSLPPLIVGQRALPRLMPFSAGTIQAGVIVGPALSGFLYDADEAIPYGVAGGLYVIGGASLLVLHTVRAQVRTDEGRRSWHMAIEGLRFVRRDQVLLGAISLDMFAVLFGGAVALLPAIAEDRLGVGNVAYGWLRAAPGIGAVAVTLVLAMRPARRSVGQLMFAAVSVFGIGTVALGFTRNYVVAFVALVVLSGADSISVFIRGVMIPLATPDHMRGRVMSVDSVFIGASNELGAFESGIAALLFGIGPAIVIGGSLTLVVVVIWCVAFPRLRHVDRFDDVDVEGRDLERSSVPVTHS
jgi:MFS family permease